VGRRSPRGSIAAIFRKDAAKVPSTFVPVSFARLLAVLLTAALLALASSSLTAVPPPPDIPTTRNESAAKRFDSIAALLDAKGASTVIVLHDVRSSTPSNNVLTRRVDSAVELLKYGQDKGARVLVMSRTSQMPPRHVPAGNRLPAKIEAAIRADKLLGRVGLEPATGAKALRGLVGSKTVLAQYLHGVEHIILISGNRDYDIVVPLFEAAHAGVNAHRNPLLDITDMEPDRAAGNLSLYIKRLSDMWPRSERLTLPNSLVEDSFVHYVPVGSIPGVIQSWTPGPTDVRYFFHNDGTRLPHVVGDPDTPAQGYAGALPYNQYDVQVRLNLDETFLQEAKFDHKFNARRSALVALPAKDVTDFATKQKGVTDSAALKTAFDASPLKGNANGIALPDKRLFDSYGRGYVEITVDAHGGSTTDGGYRVGELSPEQLGTIIAEHPEVGLSTRAPNDRPRVAHLRMHACGVRCNRNYVVNSGPDLSSDEIDYAKRVVRWLAGRSIDVDRVSVANTRIFTAPWVDDAPNTTWFRIVDSTGQTQNAVRESKLLSTTMAYDRALDAFTDDRGFVLAEHMTALNGVAMHAAPGQLEEAVPGKEVWTNATTTTQQFNVGTTMRSANGATISVQPADDVVLSLDAPRQLTMSEAWELAFHRDAAGTLTEDLMVSTADLMALAMGMRPQPGRVVVVDTSPYRISALGYALAAVEEAKTPREWIEIMRAVDMASGANVMEQWLTGLAVAPMDDPLAHATVVEAFKRLQARANNDEFSVFGADLGTLDGAAVVNADLGSVPVRAMWLPSEERILVEGARLDVRTNKAAYLNQFHKSIALLADPDTRILQEVAGTTPRTIEGEQAVRNLFGLRGAQTLAAAAGGAAAPTAIVGSHHDRMLIDAAKATVGTSVDGILAVDKIDEELRGRGPLSRAWNAISDRIGALTGWLRQHLMTLLARFGVVHPDAALTPGQAIVDHALDPVLQRIDGEQLAVRYAAATRDKLREAGLDVHDWIPVLRSARTRSETATPCETSPCLRELSREYTLDVMHEGTEEIRTITVDDPVFAEARRLVEGMQAEMDARIAAGMPDGTNGYTVNSAFALMGLLHVLESQREKSDPAGLPENLARSLQIQMYVGMAQGGVGVADDAARVARLVREGMDVTRQIETAAASDATLVARVLGMSSRVFGPAAGLLTGAMVGFDIYNLANATTDAQRAEFKANLAGDVAFATAMTTAFVAEMSGATVISGFVSGLAVPLTGLIYGFVSLAHAFEQVAQTVDEVATKFDKFGDYYPRTPWNLLELIYQMDPAYSVRTRQHLRLDGDVLSPAHGAAIDRIHLIPVSSKDDPTIPFIADQIVDLTRDLVSFTGESYIQPTNWNEMIGSSPAWGGCNMPVTSCHGPTNPRSNPDPGAARIAITERLNIARIVKMPEGGYQAKTLVLPATPTSFFHDFSMVTTPGINDRNNDKGHMLEGFPGYYALRKLESNDPDHGPFVFDATMNLIFDIGLGTMQETLQPTPVTVWLDRHVTTLALPIFTTPKDANWTEEQQKKQRAATVARTRLMSYIINPHPFQIHPMTVQLQNDYGEILLKAQKFGGASTWMLDARMLRSPGNVAVSVAGRGGTDAAFEHGVVSIDGLTIRIVGPEGTKTKDDEGDAHVWLVLPHGTWQVDFAKREIKSVDLLAATDLGQFASVKDAMLKKGFNLAGDQYIEIGTASNPTPYTIHGVPVKRYWQSVKDPTVLHALNEANYGNNATFVHGDTQEAFFHDAAAGLMHRVRRGDTEPSDTYHLGFTKSDGTVLPATINRITRVDGGTFMLLASYPMTTPAWMTSATDASKIATSTSTHLDIVYRLTHDDFEITGLSDNATLSAWLEDAKHAGSGTVDGLDDVLAAVVGTFPKAIGLPNRITPVTPDFDDYVVVHGRIRDAGEEQLASSWVRTSDGQVFSPAWSSAATACRAAGKYVQRNPTTNKKEAGPDCTLAWPKDVMLVGTFEKVADDQQPVTTWGRFWSPSLRALYEVRGFGQTGRNDNLKTFLIAIGDAADNGARSSLPVAADGDGLWWNYAEGGHVLARVSETFVTAGAKFWERVAAASRKDDPDGKGPPVLVEGGQDPDGVAIRAWYLPASKRWALAEDGAVWLGATASVAYIRVGNILHEATLIDAKGMANAFDGRKLRMPVSTRSIDPDRPGMATSVRVRNDATCNGTEVEYADGMRACLSTRSARRTILQASACPGEVPPRLALAIYDHDYVRLVCRPKNGGADAMQGWLTPDRETISEPADARLQRSGTRVLGFNKEKGEAWFFVPSEHLLCSTDWKGASKRCVWMIDAQRIGDALFLKQPSPGIASGDIPLLDGVETLALASDGERSVRYRIDSAERVHYRRIVVDMGDRPLGSWQARKLELAFADASDLRLQRWPGGWRAHDVSRGRTLELRGSGGFKSLVFLDTNKSLDLSTMRPLTFVTLPDGYVEPVAKPTSPSPAMKAAFTDRHDVDGDGIADLIAIARDGDFWSDTHWRTDVAYRNADGSVREWVQWNPRDVLMEPFDGTSKNGFWTVDGTTYHCGMSPGLSHLVCWNIDGRPMEFVAEYGGGITPWPKASDDLTPWVEALVRRVPSDLVGVQDGEGPRFQRFNGSTMECLAEANGQCHPYATSDSRSFPRALVTRATLCEGASPPAWCTKGLAQQNPRHVEKAWVMDGNASAGWVYRINEGEVECASYDGRHCLGSSVAPASLDKTRLKPLRCGVPHQLQWGSPGYGQSNHWCERYRPDKTSTGTGGATGVAPTVSNLRITGDWRVGATLRGEYDFHDADGDKEGESLYQWYVSDPTTGVPVVVAGAKARTYTLRPEDAGANRKVWFNIERLRSTTGIPRDAIGMPIGASRTGAIEGQTAAPEARNVTVTPVHYTNKVRVMFDFHHKHGHKSGTHKARIYRGPALSTFAAEPLGAPNGCMAPQQPMLVATIDTTETTVEYTIAPGDRHQHLWAEVVPATAMGNHPPAVSAWSTSIPIAPRQRNFGHDTNYDIRDLQTIESTKTIDSTEAFKTLTVSVDIKHTYIGDLMVSLVAPWGDAFPLHEGTGGSADNLLKTYHFTMPCLRDQKGMWRLRVYDRAGGDVGYLDSFDLRFD
jgi:hypothetical protein